MNYAMIETLLNISNIYFCPFSLVHDLNDILVIHNNYIIRKTSLYLYSTLHNIKQKIILKIKDLTETI